MIGMVKSDISGLYKLSTEERREIIAKEVGLEPDEVEILKKFGGLDEEVADRMIENVIGSFPLPLGIATNFV
ncbi:MAG: hypothetical protein QXN01_03520, partial [Candidatus Anstonellales archaeon]